MKNESLGTVPTDSFCLTEADDEVKKQKNESLGTVPGDSQRLKMSQ